MAQWTFFKPDRHCLNAAPSMKEHSLKMIKRYGYVPMPRIVYTDATLNGRHIVLILVSPNLSSTVIYAE